MYPERKRILRVVFVGVSVISALLVAGILFEIILQITDTKDYDTFMNDPATGLLLYKPNITFPVQTVCYSNVVHTNSEGFNAPEQPPISKSPHEYRIEIVSASFVDAEQVPLNERMSTELEQKLNAQPNQPYTYRVIPIAFGGTGTFLDMLYYVRFGQPLHPDLVIYLTTEGIANLDATGNSGEYTVGFDPQGNLITTLPSSYTNSRSGIFKSLLRKSKLAMAVFEKLQGYVGQANSDINRFLVPLVNKFMHKTDVSVSANDAWNLEGKLIDLFNAYAKETPAKFMVASWDTPFGTQDEAQSMHDNLVTLSAKDTFSYLDLAPFIAEQASSTGVSPVWGSCDGHWSAAGNEYAAEGMYKYLESHPALLGR